MTTDRVTDLIYELLVIYFNLSPDWLIYRGVNVPGLKEYSISNTTYLQAISDLCEKFGLFLVEMPDSTLVLIPDPWFTRDENGLEPSITWTTENSIVSDISFEPNPNYRRAKIKVRDPGSNTTQEFLYPEGIAPQGKVYDAGELIAPLSNGPFLAQMAYVKAHSTRAWKVEPVGLIDHVWGFQVHEVQWEDLEGLGIVDQIDIQEGPESYSARIGLQEIKAT